MPAVEPDLVLLQRFKESRDPDAFREIASCATPEAPKTPPRKLFSA
jgi:hypothetical protein